MLIRGERHHVSDVEHQDASTLLNHLFHYPVGDFDRPSYPNELIDRLERGGYVEKTETGRQDPHGMSIFKYRLTSMGRAIFIGKVEVYLKPAIDDAMKDLLGAEESFDTW